MSFFFENRTLTRRKVEIALTLTHTHTHSRARSHARARRHKHTGGGTHAHYLGRGKRIIRELHEVIVSRKGLVGAEALGGLLVLTVVLDDLDI